MNNRDLHAVIESLDTLDSLARLFKNLWFARVREEIRDEKVKAYLMVFEDAFPGVNHVLRFVRQQVEALAAGEEEVVPEGLAALAQALLQGEGEERSLDGTLSRADRHADTESDELAEEEAQEIDPAMFREESLEHTSGATADEQEALASVKQGDIDALFSAGPAAPANQAESIDALFEGSSSGSEVDSVASSDDIEAFLASADESVEDADPEDVGIELPMESVGADDGADEATDEAEEASEEVTSQMLETDLAAVVEDEALEDELGEEDDGMGDLMDAEEGDGGEGEDAVEVEESVDLEELLGDDDEGDDSDEELDLEELLADDEDDDAQDAGADSLDDDDLASLLESEGEEEEEAVLGSGPEISEDEMAALLGGADADAEEAAPKKSPPPRPKSKAKVRPKTKAKPKPKPKPKAAPKKEPAPPADGAAEALDDLGNGEETISQEEIDSLFG